MIDPEDGTLSGQDTGDRVYDVNNDRRPSANFPGDDQDNGFEDNREQAEVAGRAAEPSFTLEAERGIAEDSETEGSNPGEQNIKQDPDR